MQVWRAPTVGPELNSHSVVIMIGDGKRHNRGDTGVRNERNLTLTMTLVGVMTVMPIWYVYAYLRDRGLVGSPPNAEFAELMGRGPVWFHGPDEGRFFSGVFQEKLEEAAADHIPSFVRVGRAYRSIERKFNYAVLKPLPDSWTPAIPVGNGILTVPNEERLVAVPKINRPGDHVLLAERARYYRQVAQTNPSCRLFVVAILPAGDWLAKSTYFQISRSGVLTGDRDLRDFQDELAPNIGYMDRPNKNGNTSAI